MKERIKTLAALQTSTKNREGIKDKGGAGGETGERTPLSDEYEAQIEFMRRHK